MTAALDEFTKKVEQQLIDVYQLEVWQQGPSFPWKQFSESFQHMLKTASFSVSLKKAEWKERDQMKAEDKMVSVVLNMAPLSGQIHWLIPPSDLKKITANTLSTERQQDRFTDPKLQEGFYRFLCMQAVDAIEKIAAFSGTTIRICPAAPIAQERCLCIDVEIAIDEESVIGTLVCPYSFVLGFLAHFKQIKASVLADPLIREAMVSLHLEIGTTTLSLNQWQQVESGDFILLDRCSYDPEGHKGFLSVSLNQVALFRARLKEDGLKISDYAFYDEETVNMDKTDRDEDSPDELEATSGRLDKLVSTQEIPVVLTVELARIQMNVEKLLSIKPGNAIDLAIRPEQGVDVVVNGKKVARGELIKMGDTIGVRILEIG